MPDNWAGGNAYEAYVGRWSRRIGRSFLAWLSPAAGATWLDLGCGTGALTAQILETCSPESVLGVDPSEQFLAAAEKDLPDSRVVFRSGDGEQVPAADASFDIVVSGFALNFVPDAEKAMAEQLRVLRPSGTLAAYVWDYAGHAQFIRLFWDTAAALDPTARDLHEGVRFPLCRPDALRALFLSAGLQEVEIEPIDIPMPFASFDEYWRPFTSGVGPAPGYLVSLDPAARQALRNRLQHSIPTDPDGRILLSARAWAVRGRKAAG